MKGFLKGLGIAVSAIVLTTFTIDAADNLGNMKQSILGAVLFGVIGESSPCPEDMAIVDTSEGGFCIDVYEASAAGSMIDAVDDLLASVNSERANLGAVQNRFESVIRNGENVVENLSASRSRIEDADFAQETANLTKFQILQQAGTSVLSQANALPQSVLGLL